jgi:hypothetical protein
MGIFGEFQAFASPHFTTSERQLDLVDFSAISAAFLCALCVKPLLPQRTLKNAAENAENEGDRAFCLHVLHVHTGFE